MTSGAGGFTSRRGRRGAFGVTLRHWPCGQVGDPAFRNHGFRVVTGCNFRLARQASSCALRGYPLAPDKPGSEASLVAPDGTPLQGSALLPLLSSAYADQHEQLEPRDGSWLRSPWHVGIRSSPCSLATRYRAVHSTGATEAKLFQRITLKQTSGTAVKLCRLGCSSQEGGAR